MICSRSARGLAALGMIVALGLAPAASATTATGRQNPELTVSVSLASNGVDPDVATAGDTVTATLSLTNDTWEFQEVEMRLTLVTPDGRFFPVSTTLYLAPFQTLAPRARYTVNEYFPEGPYRLTLEARNSNGASSATATLTIT